MGNETSKFSSNYRIQIGTRRYQLTATHTLSSVNDELDKSTNKMCQHACCFTTLLHSIAGQIKVPTKPNQKKYNHLKVKNVLRLRLLLLHNCAPVYTHSPTPQNLVRLTNWRVQLFSNYSNI